MLLMEERRNEIMKDLERDNRVYVSHLAQKFQVTYETIRKDLAYLEHKGLLIKSHGGAILKQNAFEKHYQTREKENNDYKKEIALKALELIPENSSILIGTGSTTFELALLLAEKSNYKIFTDSIPVATALLNSQNQVFLFGGELRSPSSSVSGGWTVSQIRQIYVDVCFLGSDGFKNIDGPSTPSSSDAFIDQEILSHSDKKYILADYTKFQRNSLYKICDWSDITGLITNKEANQEHVEQLRRHTQVILP